MANYTQEKVRVGDLLIDPDYQREEQGAHVNKIAKNYDARGVHQLVVSRRENGLIYIIDGQHEVAATKLILGNDALMEAKVWIGLTKEEEAQLYSLLNGTKYLTAGQKMRADVQAGHPDAIDTLRIVQKNGMNIRLDSAGFGAGSKGCITAIAAVRSVYAKRGPVVLDQTIGFLFAAFGTDQAGYEASIIDGTAAFLSKTWASPIDKPALVKKLRDKGPSYLKRAAATSAVEGGFVGGGSGAASKVKMALALLHDKGRRNSRLIEVRDE